MTKILSALSIAALSIIPVFTSSCGNNSKDDTARQDAIADSIAREDSIWRADSLAKCSMCTPDLEFFELHGPVKSMRMNENTYSFSEQGQLVRIDGYDPFKVTFNDGYTPQIDMRRNKDGYINQMGGWECGTEFTWKNGKIVKESGGAEAFYWEYAYTYDDDGNITCRKGKEGEWDDYEKKVEYNYSYPERDAFGNWTKRVGTGTEKITTNRTITYYPIERYASNETEKGFNPDKKTYSFTGKIGGDYSATLEIGPAGGNYTISGGKRDLKMGMYDPKTGTLEMYAFHAGSNKQIGCFEGTLTGDTYKGVFTNLNTGGKVDFKLTLY